LKGNININKTEKEFTSGESENEKEKSSKKFRTLMRKTLILSSKIMTLLQKNGVKKKGKNIIVGINKEQKKL
jgi:hypothetical protein